MKTTHHLLVMVCFHLASSQRYGSPQYTSSQRYGSPQYTQSSNDTLYSTVSTGLRNLTEIERLDHLLTDTFGQARPVERVNGHVNRLSRMQSRRQPATERHPRLKYHEGRLLRTPPPPPPTPSSSHHLSQQERSYRGMESVNIPESENPPIGEADFLVHNSNKVSTVHYYGRLYTSTQFLNKHNFYRRRLLNGTEPDGFRAKEMPDLVWDQKLYEDARRHAGKCVFQHGPESEIYGENLAFSYGRIADPVESWYESRKLTGGYSQVVCATTRRVGCIMVSCPKLVIPDENRTTLNAFFSVCHYWPPKYANQEPYQKV